MSLIDKEETLNVEGILADFFLKKFEMKESEYEDDREYRKKSKHKKHKSKKSKHKHKIRSRSHSSGRVHITSKEDQRVFSSEEKDIKRLKKIKNIEARDNSKSNLYLPALLASQNVTQSLENSSLLNTNTNIDIDIPYGPSLELLFSGIETNKHENNQEASLSDKVIEEIPVVEMRNESEIKAQINADSMIVESEICQEHSNHKTEKPCSQEYLSNNVENTVANSESGTTSKLPEGNIVTKGNVGLITESKIECAIKIKEKYSRSRSRSQSKSVGRKRSRSRSKSKNHAKSKYHSRSRSKSASKSRPKHKSFRKERSYSSERSNSSSKRQSKPRHRRRSRSKSNDSRRKRKKYFSRSRSRSISKHHRRTHSRSYSRERYKSKYSESLSRFKHDRYRSRSRSVSRSNKSKYDRRRSRSRSKSREQRNKEYSPDRRSHSKRETSPKSKRSKRQSHSKSREKESDPSKEKKIDRAKILEIAQKNVLNMIEKGTMPEGLSLEQFKKEQLISLKAGGKSIQELTDFCAQLSKKENESTDKIESVTENNNQDGDTGFIHHPFKLKEQPMIKLNIKNAVQIPVKTHAEKFAETAKLSSQFPVSSGNQHKQKELEWIPVEPDANKTVQKVNEVKASIPVVPVTPKTEIITQENVKLNPTPPSSVSSTSSIPLPATPIPTLLPPPLPPLPPPPQPQILSTDTDQNQLEYSVSTINAEPSSVSYPVSSSGTPFSVLPDNSGVITAGCELPSSSSAACSTTFKPTKPIDIASIVTKRFKALTKLQEDPNDASALQTLQEAQTSIQEWVQSQQVPGLFTGSTDAKLLSVEELCGPKNWNYRVKRDIFARAAPVTEGKGMSLLKKMGWNPGEGLGKNKEGSLEPLVLDIKTDKKGLVSEGEGGRKGICSSIKELQGKHPVSALMELCSKRKWKPPLYTVIKDQGPPHRKIFLFKVEVNGVEHIPATPSSNKKVAKADAAIVCLQALNVFPK